MQPDPFGHLKDWGPVLELVYRLADSGKLGECQPGLARILTYRDNWRLREETLKKIGAIAHPSEALLDGVLNIIADDNIYYEARILACEALADLLKNMDNSFAAGTKARVARILTEGLAIPQPPLFAEALERLHRVVHERFGMAREHR